MTGERKLRPRREDAEFPAFGIVYEHRLGEAEVGRDRLTILLRHLGAFEKHAQGVAAGVAFADEDFQDV